MDDRKQAIRKYENLPQEEKDKLEAIFKEAMLESSPTMYAIHKMAKHWVESERAFEIAAARAVEEDGPKWVPDMNDDDSLGEYFADKDEARAFYDQTMIPLHRYSCVVLLYSIIEKELQRLVENLDKKKGRQKLKYKDIKAASAMEQVAKYCEVFYDLRLRDCDYYESLCDLQKIRDCIVHCLGDVKQSRDEGFLKKLHTKRHGFVGSHGGQMHVSSVCIQDFFMEVWLFFTSVFKKLDWKIASYNEEDKLTSLFAKAKIR